MNRAVEKDNLITSITATANPATEEVENFRKNLGRIDLRSLRILDSMKPKIASDVPADVVGSHADEEATQVASV